MAAPTRPVPPAAVPPRLLGAVAAPAPPSAHARVSEMRKCQAGCPKLSARCKHSPSPLSCRGAAAALLAACDFGADFGRCRPTSAQNRPHLARCRLMFGRWRSLARLGRAARFVCRSRSNSAGSRIKLGPSLWTLDRCRPIWAASPAQPRMRRPAAEAARPAGVGAPLVLAKAANSTGGGGRDAGRWRALPRRGVQWPTSAPRPVGGPKGRWDLALGCAPLAERLRVSGNRVRLSDVLSRC